MFPNAFRSIKSGWLFQLNGDITCHVCWADLDLLEFSVTSVSIPKISRVYDAFTSLFFRVSGFSSRLLYTTYDCFLNDLDYLETFLSYERLLFY